MNVDLSLLDLKFLGLLTVVAISRPLWPVRHYPLCAAIASAVLIGLASPTTLAVILFLSIAIIYPAFRLLSLAHERKWPRWQARLTLFGAIGTFVALLFLFKVHRHFTFPWAGQKWFSKELLALVGFSYFVLKAISLLHLQSILKHKERSPWSILSFTLFPPTITSGPIQKFQDFHEQVNRPLPLSWAVARTAGYRITRGYFRKVAVAFALNGVIEKMLPAKEFTIATSIAIITLLYLYFYFDFAGYSDIAIGFGLLIGIKVPENFRKPFLATTVSEFWRNWHITLVDWFRDNIFIPLGGMQASRQRAAMLAFLIMALCGLWHGITWPFFAWGLWHGAVLCIEALTGSKPVPPARRSGLRYWVQVLWTNARVALPCVLFLPDSATIARIASGFTRWSLT
jgi:alginate O-acetyltransferase complex protein AlgI